MATMTASAEPIAIPADAFDAARHNGTVTISNPATGGHRTFKIHTARRGNLAGKRILSLLTGADNGGSDDDDSGDYLGFAFVDETGRVGVWGKHRGTDFETFARMIAEPARYLARGIEYRIAGTCRRCNRKLTVPGSIDSGYGPECRAKIAAGL